MKENKFYGELQKKKQDTFPYPVEGDFIETKKGLIFEIKGFQQPKDRVLAFLRYFPISSQPTIKTRIKKNVDGRIKNDSLYYKKCYPLQERFIYLEKNHPKYLFNHSDYYFRLQAVHMKDIVKFYNPTSFLKKINDINKKNRSIKNVLLNDTLDFCKILSNHSGVRLNFFGITGSLLLGLDTPNSDIDIIIYGFENSLKVRSTIRHFFADYSDGEKEHEKEHEKENRKKVRRYSKKEFKKLYKFRAKGSPISFFQFLKYESRKLHQGIFRKKDFFIRFLQYEDRNSYKKENCFEKRKIISLGRLTISGQIREDIFWWTTPLIIKFTNTKILEGGNLKPGAKEVLKRNNLEINDISTIFSLWGRFTENIRLLENFKASGTVELINLDNGIKFIQLSLGSSKNDYLILE